MASPLGSEVLFPAAPPRGHKRKQSDSTAAPPRLTPSQRLAAARRAGLATKVDPARLEEEDGDDVGHHNKNNNDNSKAATAATRNGANHDDADATAGATTPSWLEKARREDGEYETLYASELDFEALGKEDADFGALLAGGKHLDFTDPAAMMQLTKMLLKRDFGLRVELPDDRLCPPVPNRHNYILWLKALLDTSSPTYADAYEPERQVTGLDVGTGASAIYPLLGCAQRPGWSFIATDIDAKSLSCARRNVELNKLESRIQVVERKSGAADVPLIPLDELDRDKIDFVMTNPPFYESGEELRDLAARKALPPSSACTGAPHEMVYSVDNDENKNEGEGAKEGGEVGFIQRLLNESLVLRERVQWYTAMVGKQSSLGVVVDRLRAAGIDNYAVAQFVQGHKTRRWAVGWSFGMRRPGVKACRGGVLHTIPLVVAAAADESSGSKNVPLPPVTEMTVASKTVRSPTAAKQLENTFWTQLEDVTDGLDLVAWSLDEERLRGVGFTEGNVWGRAYRRQKRRAATTSAENGNGSEGGDAKKGREEDGFVVAAAAKGTAEEHKKESKEREKKKKKKEPAECSFGFSISIKTKSRPNTEGVLVHEVVAVVRWLQGSEFGLFESFCGMLRNGFVAVTN